MTAQSGQASPADERREVVARVLVELDGMTWKTADRDLALSHADAVLAALSPSGETCACRGMDERPGCTHEPSDEARGAEVERLRGEVAERGEQLNLSAEAMSIWMGRAERAEAALAAGLALHSGTHWCTDDDGRSDISIPSEGLNYPCPTRRALSGDTEGGDQ